ncbi:MAG: helix-turn-helix domain-containing protein [Desulfobacteraceae bacterium]|nr:MAG: helix-turn-helix domain-containing protein [Desulfobacteraceae bacterium]
MTEEGKMETTERKKRPLPEPRFWSCEETARYLNISIHTLYKSMSKGKCPIAVKRPLGSRPMFDSEDVKRYVDSL